MSSMRSSTLPETDWTTCLCVRGGSVTVSYVLWAGWRNVLRTVFKRLAVRLTVLQVWTCFCCHQQEHTPPGHRRGEGVCVCVWVLKLVAICGMLSGNSNMVTDVCHPFIHLFLNSIKFGWTLVCYIFILKGTDSWKNHVIPLFHKHVVEVRQRWRRAVLIHCCRCNRMFSVLVILFLFESFAQPECQTEKWLSGDKSDIIINKNDLFRFIKLISNSRRSLIWMQRFQFKKKKDNKNMIVSLKVYQRIFDLFWHVHVVMFPVCAGL